MHHLVGVTSFVSTDRLFYWPSGSQSIAIVGDVYKNDVCKGNL